MRTITICEQMPEGFQAKVEAAACYLEFDGNLLLLQNSPSKKEALKWGVPAGKIEGDETPLEAAQRELFEETGISLEADRFQPLGSLFIRKPEVDYVYHRFLISLTHQPSVTLSSEHQDYKWASGAEVDVLPLMEGGYEAYTKFRSIQRAKRGGTWVNCYLVLRKEGKILLQLRKNTGYCDGMWSFVSGHVEDGEPTTEGMMREVEEEIGIRPTLLRPIHVMHRKTLRLNIDIFFECTSWEGEIVNREPKKCERLEFFPLDQLPDNLIDYNLAALKAAAEENFYSEYGWEL